MPRYYRPKREPIDLRPGWEKIGLALGNVIDQPTRRDEAIAISKDLGVARVRVDFNWAAVEGTQGVFNWSAADALVTRCRTAGLEILANHSKATPGWARADSGAVDWPNDPADYANYLNLFQARYPDVRHHQIGNELNNSAVIATMPSTGIWAGKSRGGCYAQLMRGIYGKMHTQDPGCLVVTCGLAHVGDSTTDAADSNRTGKMSALEFMGQFYYDHGGAHCDAVAAHPYGTTYAKIGDQFQNDSFLNADQKEYVYWNFLGPSRPGTAPPNVYANSAGARGPVTQIKARGVDAATPAAVVSAFSSIRQVMTHYGDAAKKIWITETGVNTSTAGVSQAVQLENVKRFFHIAQNIDWIGACFWYQAKDIGSDQSNPENGYGLVLNNGTPKTAYAEFKSRVAMAARSR